MQMISCSSCNSVNVEDDIVPWPPEAPTRAKYKKLSVPNQDNSFDTTLSPSQEQLPPERPMRPHSRNVHRNSLQMRQNQTKGWHSINGTHVKTSSKSSNMRPGNPIPDSSTTDTWNNPTRSLQYPQGSQESIVNVPINQRRPSSRSIVKSRSPSSSMRIRRPSFTDNQGSQEFPNGEPVPGKSHENRDRDRPPSAMAGVMQPDIYNGKPQTDKPPTERLCKKTCERQLVFPPSDRNVNGQFKRNVEIEKAINNIKMLPMTDLYFMNYVTPLPPLWKTLPPTSAADVNFYRMNTPPPQTPPPSPPPSPSSRARESASEIDSRGKNGSDWLGRSTLINRYLSIKRNLMRAYRGYKALERKNEALRSKNEALKMEKSRLEVKNWELKDENAKLKLWMKYPPNPDMA